MRYKPDGFTSLAPYALVADVRAALAFVEAVFDAAVIDTLPGEGDTLRHAAVRIDDTVLMLGQMPPGQPINLHLYAPDVDAVFARAVAAGGTPVEEPALQFYGDRRGAVTDPAGITWWIATRTEAANGA